MHRFVVTLQTNCQTEVLHNPDLPPVSPHSRRHANACASCIQSCPPSRDRQKSQSFHFSTLCRGSLAFTHRAMWRAIEIGVEVVSMVTTSEGILCQHCVSRPHECLRLSQASTPRLAFMCQIRAMLMPYFQRC